MTGLRPDITDVLVHYIRGAGLDDAFATLRRILDESRLRCGTGYIRGGHCCICFSEAPFTLLGRSIAQGYFADRPYQPFGVLVSKSWLFAQGGRPVIYQPDDEYDALPPDLRWRHVRYEPGAEPPVDFTWEREWRVHVDGLLINLDVAEVVVLSTQDLHVLRQEHEREQDMLQQQYAQVIGELTSWQLRDDLPWRVRVLNR